MLLKFASALLVVAAVTSVHASACTGPTILYSDNFQQPNAAWQTFQGSTLGISGGFLQLTPPKGNSTAALYTGGYLDSADACVDVTTPAALADPNGGVTGVVFGYNIQGGDHFAFVMTAGGSIGVLHFFRGQEGQAINALTPFAAAPAIKAGPNATNTLRVTWKGTAGIAYANGQQVATFTIPIFQNTLFGFYAQGDASKTAAATWQFTNVKVTNVP
jgi:hypothetical protein